MKVKPNELVILINLNHKRGQSQFEFFFTPGMEFTCHKGNIKFGEVLYYGELVFTNKNEHFLVVHPNSKDKMLKVDRSTTIVYPKDLGMIIMELGIISGSRVVEIGTGSGSLTFSLANIVGEKGKIDTVDVDQKKQEKGKKNFRIHSKFQNTEWHIKDLTKEKLDVPAADAIFIDIPEAYSLVKSIRYLLKDGHAIGILCPSFEQVKANANALNESGFTRIRCQELLERKIFVRKNSTRPADTMHAHTAFYIFAEKIADKDTESVLKLGIRQTVE